MPLTVLISEVVAGYNEGTLLQNDKITSELNYKGDD